MVQRQMTPLKVWLQKGCNHISHLHAPVTALMFSCSGTKIYDPEVRNESSGQPWDNYRASWSSVLSFLSVHHKLSLKTTVELLVICGRGSNLSVYLTTFCSKYSECCWRRQLLFCATWLSGLLKPSQLRLYVCIGNQTSIEILAVRYRTSSPFIVKNVHLFHAKLG